ncbi:MAG TPA: hypothetical protein VK071_01050 [Tissierellales bacterium]|nr:hypothetical protein [Tissierellales bacterium]
MNISKSLITIKGQHYSILDSHRDYMNPISIDIDKAEGSNPPHSKGNGFYLTIVRTDPYM